MISFRNIVITGSVIFLIIACSSQKDTNPQSEPLPVSKLDVRDAWVRPAQQGGTSGAYLTIANGTRQADTLLRLSTNAADIAEVHESFQQENGLSGMRPAGKLPIDPQSVTELKPGGYHIMLMQLTKNLAVGDTISATLYFSGNDSIAVQIPVQKN